TIKTLEAFEVEQVLGVPAGILVYSTRVFNLLRISPPDEPQAMALSTFFLLILFVLVVCYRLLLQRAHIAATLTGKGARLLARERTAGAYVVAGLLFFVLAVTVVLPFALVAMCCSSPLFGFFGIEHPWPAEPWGEVLQRPAFASALRQSVLMGTVVALGGTLISLAPACFTARHSFRGKAVMSLAIWLPWAIPG